jgi:hypothetical protein
MDEIRFMAVDLAAHTAYIIDDAGALGGKHLYDLSPSLAVIFNGQYAATHPDHFYLPN